MPTRAPRRRLDRALHELFEASLALKGVLAVGEFLAGVALWLVGNAWIVGLVRRLTLHEITEDPSDRVAAMLLHLARGLSVDVQTFYAWYLASHGLVKMALVFGLWRGWSWSYPVSLVALVLFIAYQLHRYAATGSWSMLALSALDVVVIALVWREWHRQRPAV